MNRLSAVEEAPLVLPTEHEKRVSVGIGQLGPEHVIPTRVDPGGAESDEPIDLGGLIICQQVEVEAVLSTRHYPGRPERDEGPSAIRSPNGNIAILVVDHRPSDRLPPEVAGHWIGGLEDDGSDVVGVGEELSTDDDAELVAFGVGQHDVFGIWTLPDVDALGAECS